MPGILGLMATAPGSLVGTNRVMRQGAFRPARRLGRTRPGSLVGTNRVMRRLESRSSRNRASVPGSLVGTNRVMRQDQGAASDRPYGDQDHWLGPTG